MNVRNNQDPISALSDVRLRVYVFSDFKYITAVGHNLQQGVHQFCPT